MPKICKKSVCFYWKIISEIVYDSFDTQKYLITWFLKRKYRNMHFVELTKHRGHKISIALSNYATGYVM